MRLTTANDNAATIAVGMMIHAFLRSSASQTRRRSRSPRAPVAGPAGSAGGGLTAGAALRAEGACGGGAVTGATAGCAGGALAFSDCQNFRRIAHSYRTQPSLELRRRLQSIMVAAALISRKAARGKPTAQDARHHLLTKQTVNPL